MSRIDSIVPAPKPECQEQSEDICLSDYPQEFHACAQRVEAHNKECQQERAAKTLACEEATMDEDTYCHQLPRGIVGAGRDQIDARQEFRIECQKAKATREQFCTEAENPIEKNKGGTMANIDPKTVSGSCFSDGKYLYSATVAGQTTVIDPQAKTKAEECAGTGTLGDTVEGVSTSYTGPGGTLITEFFNVVSGNKYKLEGGCRK